MTTFTREQFTTALASFVAGCDRITAEYHAKHFPNIAPTAFDTTTGPRYVRVARTDTGSRSVHCFIDRATGAVLKAAGWKAPAKHARGNILDAANGLGAMGPFGPAYLR